MNVYLYTPADLEKCSFIGADSKLFPTTSAFMNSQNVILKLYQIVCYDINLYNNAETTVTIDHLQSIADSIKLFDTNAECLENIEQTKSINTFIIVSEQHAEDFIPKIHTQENILLIYIIRQNCESLSSYQSLEWISKFQKVS